MNIGGEEIDEAQVLIMVNSGRRIARDGTGRQVREESGASQSEIGRAVGVSKASVCKWELRQREPVGAHAVMYWIVIQSLVATNGDGSND
ncbi:MAG TPA: hypothetical protein VII60_05690 [Acidimicrobiales bacterium]